MTWMVTKPNDVVRAKDVGDGGHMELEGFKALCQEGQLQFLEVGHQGILGDANDFLLGGGWGHMDHTGVVTKILG